MTGVKEISTNILDNIRKRKLVKRYLILLVSLFASAICFNLFVMPTKIVSGGTNGLAVIIEHLFHFEPAKVILVISVILLLLSLFCLGMEKTSGTIVATIVYPIFVSLTRNIGSYIVIDLNDYILISIFIGIITGITNGLIFKIGFSSSGLSILSQIIYKYTKISISKSNFLINALVVIAGGFFFGWTMVLYAVIVLYINSLIIDKVLIGISKNKAFYIITSEEAKVKDYIINQLKHSITIFDVKGGFLKTKNKVIMAVVPTREYFKVTEGIKEIDNEAFFVVCDAYQVEGGA